MDSTGRVISIVSYLAADQKKHTLTEICHHAQTSKATTYRILSTLRLLKWVTKEERTRKYSVGPALLEVGLLALSSSDIRRVSLPFLSH